MSPAKTGLGGPEENKSSMNQKLCSACEGILTRPHEEWDNKKGSQICYTKRAVDDVMSSANSGCVICEILHNAILPVIEVRPWLKDGGVSCGLHWNNKGHRFDDIYFSLAQVQIKLLLEEGMPLSIKFFSE
jgi:hypothetical protein